MENRVKRLFLLKLRLMRTL